MHNQEAEVQEIMQMEEADQLQEVDKELGDQCQLFQVIRQPIWQNTMHKCQIYEEIFNQWRMRMISSELPWEKWLMTILDNLNYVMKPSREWKVDLEVLQANQMDLISNWDKN